MKQAVLIRKPDDGIETQGALTCFEDESQKNIIFHCITLELPYDGNHRNTSCIPNGKYVCRWTFSPRLKKETFEITGVTDRAGIRVHSSNYVSELRGCIALGSSYTDLNKDGELDIINSRKTISEFETAMGKTDFLLTII